MKNIKVSVLLSMALLITGLSGEAKADSCATVIDNLVAWIKAPCNKCKNIVSYQMSLMNNDKFVGYSSGQLEYIGDYFYTNSAKTLFSDRIWAADCKPAAGLICQNNQPFDYHRPETFAFKLKKPSTLSLDLTSWNESYTINLSCQNGYMYGFQPGKHMIMLYPKKDKQVIPQ